VRVTYYKYSYSFLRDDIGFLRPAMSLSCAMAPAVVQRWISSGPEVHHGQFAPSPIHRAYADLLGRCQKKGAGYRAHCGQWYPTASSYGRNASVVSSGMSCLRAVSIPQDNPMPHDSGRLFSHHQIAAYLGIKIGSGNDTGTYGRLVRFSRIPVRKHSFLSSIQTRIVPCAC